MGKEREKLYLEAVKVNKNSLDLFYKQGREWTFLAHINYSDITEIYFPKQMNEGLFNDFAPGRADDFCRSVISRRHTDLLFQLESSLWKEGVNCGFMDKVATIGNPGYYFSTQKGREKDIVFRFYKTIGSEPVGEVEI